MMGGDSNRSTGEEGEPPTITYKRNPKPKSTSTSTSTQQIEEGAPKSSKDDTRMARIRDKQKKTPPTNSPRGKSKKYLGAGFRGITTDDVPPRRMVECDVETTETPVGIVDEAEAWILEDERDVDLRIEAQSSGVGGGSQEGEGCSKGKRTYISKERDDHIPEPELMLDNGEVPYGIPADGGKVLIGYTTTWACTIYSTIDHKNATRLLRRQANSLNLRNWMLKDECDRFQQIVRNSGLLPIIKYFELHYDIESVSAFIERFHGETDTMQFSWGEMCFTPEDAKEIYNLKIDGESTMAAMKSKTLKMADIYKLCERIFGWSVDVTNNHMGKQGEVTRRELNLKRLRIEFQGTLAKEKERAKEGKELSNAEVRAAASAYLLYVLALAVFPSSKGNRVNVKLLQLLDPVEEMGEYSWGTAIISHINTELRKASRRNVNQLNCNTIFIQTWIYEHFPELVKEMIENGKLKINPKWKPGEPRAKRWVFQGKQDHNKTNWLLHVRESVDKMDVAQVLFDPYKGDRQDEEELNLYEGPFWHPFGYTMYDPLRVMRQLGYVQDKPGKVDKLPHNFSLDVTKSKGDIKCMTIVYQPEPTGIEWENRDNHCIMDLSSWQRVQLGHEHTPCYMKWYKEWSHPYVIRQEVVSHPQRKKGKKTSTTASTSKEPSCMPLWIKERFDLVLKRLRFKVNNEQGLTHAELKETVQHLDHMEVQDAQSMFNKLKRRPMRPRTTTEGSQRKRQRGSSSQMGIEEEGEDDEENEDEDAE